MEPYRVFEKVISEDKILRITIGYDSDADDPRDWSNIGHMICWNNRYKLGDKHTYCHPEELENLFAKMKEDGEEVLISPLYIYDHSGISIYMEEPAFDYGGWDTSRVGYFYILKKDVFENYPEATEESWKELAQTVLKGELEEYDLYIRGEVYGLLIEEVSHCTNCGHELTALTERVSGFYGFESVEEGIKEEGYELSEFEEL